MVFVSLNAESSHPTQAKKNWYQFGYRQCIFNFERASYGLCLSLTFILGYHLCQSVRDGATHSQNNAATCKSIDFYY